MVDSSTEEVVVYVSSDFTEEEKIALAHTHCSVCCAYGRLLLCIGTSAYQNEGLLSVSEI